MEGPRERLARLGADALADVELLAILLGTGRAGQDVMSLATGLLRESGGLGALARQVPGEIAGYPGVGPAKAARLVAAFELGVRAQCASEPEVPLNHSAAVYARYGRRLARSATERFLVIAVDAKNRPRAAREVAHGGRTHCQVDPAEVFRALVAESASGGIFVHNHPSGDPYPSPDDVALTERLIAAGALLEIRILDHLIVGGARYTSLRDAGFWPKTNAKSVTLPQ